MNTVSPLSQLAAQPIKASVHWEAKPVDVSVIVLEEDDHGGGSVALRWRKSAAVPSQGEVSASTGIVAYFTSLSINRAYAAFKNNGGLALWSHAISLHMECTVASLTEDLIGYFPPCVDYVTVEDVLCDEEYEDVRGHITKEDVRLAVSQFMSDYSVDSPIGKAIDVVAQEAVEEHSSRLAKQVAENVRARM